MNHIWSQLPKDIVNYILLFDTKIKYRNGKYMNQLPKDNKTYNLLLQIPRPISPNYIDNLYRLVVQFTHEDRSLLFMHVISHDIYKISYNNKKRILETDLHRYFF